TSLRLAPDVPAALCNLGNALQFQGRFAEALACFKRGHELGSKTPYWGQPSARWVKRAERLVALAARLPAVLQGKDRPADAAERLEFARICGYTKRYADGVRLYAEVLAAEPALAGDLVAGHRYIAACLAVLAAAQGAEATPPEDGERARLRKQALD